MEIPKRIAALFLVSLAIIIIITSLVFYNIRQFLNSNQWAALNYQVLNKLGNVVADLKDAESGTRGYVVTGKEDFLAPYYNGTKAIIPDISSLRSELANNKSQMIRLDNLDRLVKDLLMLQQKQINYRRSDKYNPTLALIDEGSSNRIMDEIRQTVSGLKDVENDLLSQRLKEREVKTFDIFAMTGIMVLLLLAAIITAILFIKKELEARKKLQETLEQSRDYSNMIIDTVPTPLIVLDASLKIINVNLSFYSHFHYTKEEIENKSFFDVIKGNFNYKELSSLLSSIIPEGTSFDNYELEFSDNWIISINARKLYRKINNVHMILVGIEDITERKKSEEKLKLAMIDLEKSHAELNESADKLKKYSEELEDLNETKDKFFSIVAHDLRSPFQAMASVANVLLEDLDSFNKESILMIAEELKNTLKIQYDVVDNLLTWVQVQRGRMEMNPRRIFLSDKVKLVTDQLIIHSQNKNISVVNNVSKDIVVIGDMNMLQTVFHNLIYNAIKYCNPGGLIEINVERSGAEIITSVRDNGIGMSENMRKIIFSVDKKVKRNGTMNEKGTGLGLNLCKEMVEKQGGRIWVESEDGKGSIFYFTLPEALKEE